MATVLLVVQPLATIRCGWEGAVQIFEIDLVAGVDGQAGGTILIAAELELARSNLFLLSLVSEYWAWLYVR